VGTEREEPSAERNQIDNEDTGPHRTAIWQLLESKPSLDLPVISSRFGPLVCSRRITERRVKVLPRNVQRINKHILYNYRRISSGRKPVLIIQFESLVMRAAIIRRTFTLPNSQA